MKPYVEISGSTLYPILRRLEAAELPAARKEKVKPKRRLKALEIIPSALGSPIWISLAVSAFAVLFSLYVVLWSAIISVWAVFVSLVDCSIGGIPACPILAIGGNDLSGVVMLAAWIVCADLSSLCSADTRQRQSPKSKLVTHARKNRLRAQKKTFACTCELQKRKISAKIE